MNELWQDIDEDGRLPNDYQPPPLFLMPDPKDAVEATVLLSMFRPMRNTMEDLKALLDAGTEPNVIVRDDDIHPLMKVMTFPDKDLVGPMRALLLQAGATENDEAQQRCKMRRRAGAYEDGWMHNLHRDPV